MSESSEAVWKKPAWITAIVGLISAFLTVPDIIGNYLTKRQDIELARENTEAVRVANVESKQDQEFKIVNSTLAQQGTERIFVLRYLAATLDDPAAKDWAGAEVARLDNLASSQEELASSKQALEKKEAELQDLVKIGQSDNKGLEDEIQVLRASLKEKTSEISELRQKAGFSGRVGFDTISIITIDLDWGADRESIGEVTVTAIVDGVEEPFKCIGQYFEVCQGIRYGEPPDSIVITNGEIFSSVSVLLISEFHPYGFVNAPYSCRQIEQEVSCTRIMGR